MLIFQLSNEPSFFTRTDLEKITRINLIKMKYHEVKFYFLY